MSRFSPEPNNGEFYLEKKKIIDNSLAIFFLSSFWFQGDASSSGLQSPPNVVYVPRFHLLHRRMRSRSYGGGAVPSCSEKKKKRNWRKTLSFEVFLFGCRRLSGSVVVFRRPPSPASAPSFLSCNNFSLQRSLARSNQVRSALANSLLLSQLFFPLLLS